jgi:type IV pilus assembly protein PilM
VPIKFSILPANSHMRPSLACEIFPGGVLAARRESGKGAQRAEEDSLTFGYAQLPESAVMPGLKSANLADPSAVSGAVRKVLEDVGARRKNVTVIVPDAAARVLLLDFDSLPSRERDALPILRFRLRKMLPFDVEDAAISYQLLPQSSQQVRALVVAMPRAILAEYESAVRDAGFEPGSVLTSTIASLSALRASGPALIINRSHGAITTAIVRQDDLLLHRTLELPQDPSLLREELAQAVSVALAYFEDTLQSLPSTIYYAGPGGASGFSELIENNDPLAPRVRDLVTPPAAASLPPGMFAGIAGALAS